MKYSYALSALALAASANAHSIMQRISVAGVDQGQLTGIRAPSSNNPVQEVSSPDLVCGADDSTSAKVITIPAGSAVGAGWAHVLGGPQGQSDGDNPIASSHKGPTQVYLAKVDDAASASATGLKWFKIASDSVTSAGVWGVDNMIKNTDANGIGWQKFTMPECIAPGQYLMRVELLALHSAGSPGGAQFYQSCAQIKVTGSGSYSAGASDQISLPGGYPANDGGIVANIYDTAIYGTYKAPGPKVITCGAGGAAAAPPASKAPVSTSAAAKVVTSAAAPVSTKAAAPVVSKVATSAAAPVSTKAAAPVVSSKPVVASSAPAVVANKPTTLATVVKSSAAAPAATKTTTTSGSVGAYERCGGTGYTGPTACISGYKCTPMNPYYSQCVAA